jgi:Flp pilus assembly protein TadD
MKIIRTILAASALAASIGSAFAVDTSYSGPATAADKLAAARSAIQAKQWSVAIDELKKVGDTGNADWNNLMGYAHRKAKTPDYTAAERYYDEALRLDPKHRGALEYSGELYLILGNLAKAEQRLAALDKVCLLPCEEYTDLKNAVARFKANGNRHVAAP